MVPSSLGALCPRIVARGTLVRGLPRPDISCCGECRRSKRGSALDPIEQTQSELQRAKRIKKNVQRQRSYICSVMAGHHCCSARAFAVNPSAPSGATLRAPGVDRSARPSKEACGALNAELRLREPLETERKKCWTLPQPKRARKSFQRRGIASFEPLHSKPVCANA